MTASLTSRCTNRSLKIYSLILLSFSPGIACVHRLYSLSLIAFAFAVMGFGYVLADVRVVYLDTSTYLENIPLQIGDALKPALKCRVRRTRSPVFPFNVVIRIIYQPPISSCNFSERQCCYWHEDDVIYSGGKKCGRGQGDQRRFRLHVQPPSVPITTCDVHGE